MTEEKSLLEALRRVNIVLKRSMSVFATDHSCVPTVASMILQYLYHEGGSSMQKDIECEFHLRRSTACQHLQRLEKEGYITRAAAEGDGRSKCIALTEKAKAEQDEIVRKFRKMELYVDEALTQEERETFCMLCGKIRKRLEPNA